MKRLAKGETIFDKILDVLAWIAAYMALFMALAVAAIDKDRWEIEFFSRP